MISVYNPICRRNRKNLKKLPLLIKKGIKKWVEKINDTKNPYYNAKHLQGNLKDYWRYRIGDYRLIYKVEDNILLIMVVDVGHRKEIHKNFDTH